MDRQEEIFKNCVAQVRTCRSYGTLVRWIGKKRSSKIAWRRCVHVAHTGRWFDGSARRDLQKLRGAGAYMSLIRDVGSMDRQEEIFKNCVAQVRTCRSYGFPAPSEELPTWGSARPRAAWRRRRPRR